MTRPESEYYTITTDISGLPRRIISDDLRERIAETGEEPPATIYDTWAEVLDALTIAGGLLNKRPAPGFVRQPGCNDNELITALVSAVSEIMSVNYRPDRAAFSSWLEDRGMEAGGDGFEPAR